ncbi:hypothetical protein KMW28_19955 [Flammeovirga yaeyamensis]|uniref:Lipoprotein n=1 Tax=Flammeovirga yaeyamensis TaxID=367791 RepID=A0AAX1N331_9BACT|nr:MULTISPECIES: hypothetical protein [Flammeovirga]ANQ50709.1 hypothetical protein MY04_3347 [Flammeovirga sp. MY04]MBB3701061.1 hypothetical protein [Flammeovirga yaeyamensis]NMF38108.1 hypothetical protein [Flammeovirga yaeyamensis]QWG01879.1 hypothetical protein KMW28_19955 [Flammeovirga yaeyamensis]
MKSLVKIACGVTVALASVLSSCEKEQYKYSGPAVPAGPSITIQEITIPETVMETDFEETVNVVLSKAYPFDIAVYIQEEEGSANTGNFYHDERVIIAAGDTVGSFVYGMELDCMSGADSQIKFSVGNKPSANATIANPQMLEFTISNNITGGFDAYQEWTLNEDNPFTEYDEYDLMDLDMYAVNADTAAAYGHDLDDPAGLAAALAYQFGAGYAGYPYSWTGGAEHLVFDVNVPNGTYKVVAEKYSDFDPGDAGDLTFSLGGEYENCGVPENNGNRVLPSVPMLSDAAGTLYIIDDIIKSDKDYEWKAAASSARKFSADQIPSKSIDALKALKVGKK